jgi:hypothetical protein
MAVQNPANTNDAKRKAAAKQILDADENVRLLRDRVHAMKQTAARESLAVELAVNEFRAARSLAHLLGGDAQ